MYKPTRALIYGSAAIFLAACGGGSTSNSENGGVQSLASDLEQSLSSADSGGAFGARAEAFEQSLTEVGLGDGGTFEPTVDLPAPGTANYTGEIGLFLGDGIATGDEPTAGVEELLLGEMNLSVDFTSAGGTFGGSASGFVDSGNEAYTGELDFENGVLAEAGTNGETGFLADLTGTLTGADGPTEFDVQATGALSGENADMVGIVSGSATADGADKEVFGLLVATDN